MTRFMIIAAIAASGGPKPVYAMESTAYCLEGKMADGTYTRKRSVANNFFPFRTKIRLKKAGPGGLRIWYVRDRIGWGTDLDFWVPTCYNARHWGRRHIKFTVIKPHR